MKMNIFYTFLFNFETVENVLRPEWIQLYDFMMIDEKVIGGLRQRYEFLSEFLAYIENKAYPAASMKTSGSLNKEEIEKKTTKQVTIPEPFNLTKTKPKKILDPIKILAKVEVKELPYEQYNKTSLLKIGEETKERKQIMNDVY